MDRALTRSLLLCHISLLALSVAEARGQAPGSRSRTSAVGTLFPDSSAAAPATPAPPPAPGALRQLVCRGNAGTHIPIEQKPSPRSAGQVAVLLAYRPSPVPAGLGYDKLEPGACSWTQVADAGTPPEPGVVHFDLEPVGSEFMAPAGWSRASGGTSTIRCSPPTGGGSPWTSVRSRDAMSGSSGSTRARSPARPSTGTGTTRRGRRMASSLLTSRRSNARAG